LPATYKIDPQRKLVVTRLWDPVTEAEVHAHNQQLRTDPLFDPTFRQLADMYDVSEVLVSTDVVRETAHDQFFTPGVRRAFVAHTDGCYGMARMFALHAETLGQVIGVFRDIKPAEEWLGLESE
jgi:hypothetical protein